MTETAVVYLALENDAQNVALVRHVIGAVGDAAGLPERLIADVKTAVSEACGNVVLHAYGGASGPMQVTIAADDGGLTILVRDRGGGIRPRRVEEEQQVRGVGLSLIQALTDSVEFRGAADAGTEVRMSFHSDSTAGLTAPEALSAEPPEDGVRAVNGEAILVVAPGALAGPALSALIAVLASRAGFSVDRLADAQLVTDTIAAHAEGVADRGFLTLAVDSGERELDMRLGPFSDGGAERLVAATAVGDIRPLEVLTDEIGTQSLDAGEYLLLRLTA